MELELVHFRDADDLDVHIRVKVATIDRIPNEFDHLQFQCIDVFKRCAEVAEYRDLLSHSLASSDVLDPQVVHDNVGDLHGLSIGHALEDGVEKGDVFDCELLGCDVDTVANVIRVLSEQKDAGTKNLLASCCKYKR